MKNSSKGDFFIDLFDNKIKDGSKNGIRFRRINDNSRTGS